tara:strand:+ start:5436 stop:6047 length:612 start_codon:yes stop_codon:yes gene_type:complete
MALVNAATLREYLPEIQGTDLDTDLNSLIGRVESAIAQYLGFTMSDGATSLTLDQATYSLFLDGPLFELPTVLQIPIKPINTITSIHSDPDLEYPSSTEIESSQYHLDKNNARVILKADSTASFDRGFRNIKVVLSAGYSTSGPPADLVHAICVYASHLQRAKTSQGNNNITQRNSTITLSPRTMPDEVKQILRGFRNVSTIF